MKVKAHLHLPKAKRGDEACISYLPYGQTSGTEYAGTLAMTNVTFKVSEAGRLRCLTENRKNVHAWVVGDILDVVSNQIPLGVKNHWRQARYNPRNGPHFVDSLTGESIHTARAAYMVGSKVYYI